MYKNQLQELAQRSCFNLPSYTCTREGPDHAPRFKATVNFNGEMFECPDYCSTLRQAEHSAAEVALKSLSTRGPSLGLAARILDETGVYKNLLQEISQRVGAPLPQYTSYRSGPRHQPVFTGTVELAGITFTGEPAKNKKQAEKNAALAAWSSLKQLAKETASSSSDAENNDELDQVTIARALLKYRIKERKALENASGPVQFNKKFPLPNPRPSISRPLPATFSKILPLICQRTPCNRPTTSRARPSLNDYSMQSIPLSEMDPSGDHYGSIPQSSSVESCGNHHFPPSQPSGTESFRLCPISSAQSFKIKYHEAQTQRFPAAEAAPYVPLRSNRRPCHGIAPAVTLRTAVPVFSAPPLPPPSRLPSDVIQGSAVRIAPPVCVKQAVSTCAAPSFWKEDPPVKARNDPLSNQKENNHASRKEPLKVQKEGPFNAVLSIAEIPTQETESMAAKKSKKESLMESPPSVSFAKFPAEKNDHAILWKYNETKTEGTSATESITATESQESETKNPALEPSLTELSIKETDATTTNLNEAEMLQNLEQLQI